MSDLAALLTAIAAVISAAGGFVIGVLALVRGSPRERQQAAQGALERLAGKSKGDDGDEDEAQWVAIAELRRRFGGES